MDMKATIVYLVFWGCIAAAAEMVQPPNCPYAFNLKPCTCDYEGINCRRVPEPLKLKNALMNYIDNPYFPDFWMNETPLWFIESGTFTQYRFLRVHMSHNQLRKFEDNAFGYESQNFTKELELGFNSFKELPMSALRTLRGLRFLDLSYNQIRTVPDQAFKDIVPELQTLMLSRNEINYLGRQAFSTLRDISMLFLDDNQLTVIEDFTFQNPYPYTYRALKLENNRIAKISPRALEGTFHFGHMNLVNNNLTRFDKDSFHNAIEILEQSSSSGISVIGNPITCDNSLLWLLEHSERTRAKISGIYCNGKHIRHVLPTDLNIY